MLHPPYTLMVLSFVTIGAAIAPRFSTVVYGATLLAYFAGLGVGAHFLDQIPGMGSHYVRHWPSWALWVGGLAGVGIGVGIGIVGAWVALGAPFLIFVVVQGLAALGYPLAPVFRGIFHRDTFFAISWGALPLLTSFYAQDGSLTLLAGLSAAACGAAAALEIHLSRISRARRSAARAGLEEGPVPRAAGNSSYRSSDRALQLLVAGSALTAGVLLLLVWVGAR
ncbi:MAG: hypothetical protein WA549_05355 [Thermoplasmata archaeon]